MSRELKEKSIRWLLTGVACVSLLSLACIMLFLFMEGLPLFADYPLWDFLTGHLWYPTSEPPEFGIFPLIMGSLAVTILASCIAVPLGIMTAAYLAGAQKGLQMAKAKGADTVLLKSKSPSCGVGHIHDGSFSGGLIPGNGVFAELLMQNGIRVLEME